MHQKKLNSNVTSQGSKLLTYFSGFEFSLFSLSQNDVFHLQQSSLFSSVYTSRCRTGPLFYFRGLSASWSGLSLWGDLSPLECSMVSHPVSVVSRLEVELEPADNTQEAWSTTNSYLQSEMLVGPQIECLMYPWCNWVIFWLWGRLILELVWNTVESPAAEILASNNGGFHWMLTMWKLRVQSLQIQLSSRTNQRHHSLMFQQLWVSMTFYLCQQSSQQLTETPDTKTDTRKTSNSARFSVAFQWVTT